MEPYGLCIEIIEDIRSRLNSPSHYNYVKISGLIRQLLFDRHPVLLMSQRYAGKPFRFFMSSRGFEYDPQQMKIKAQYLHIYGCFDMGENLIEVKPEDYGDLKVVVFNVQYWTIKDVVLYVAHKRGGIHYDSNLTDKQKPLDGISKQLQMQGTESMFNQVAYIGQNVVSSAVKSSWVGY